MMNNIRYLRSELRSAHAERIGLRSSVSLGFWHVFPVSEELGDTLVSQRVMNELGQDIEGVCCDVCSRQCTIDDMARTADTCSEHLSLEKMGVEDLYQFIDELHADVGDVIESANEW